MEEIKSELRQDNINVKCNAVAKLTYVSVGLCSTFSKWLYAHNEPIYIERNREGENVLATLETFNNSLYSA